jgi:hypothetical protein
MTASVLPPQSSGLRQRHQGDEKPVSLNLSPRSVHRVQSCVQLDAAAAAAGSDTDEQQQMPVSPTIQPVQPDEVTSYKGWQYASVSMVLADNPRVCEDFLLGSLYSKDFSRPSLGTDGPGPVLKQDTPYMARLSTFLFTQFVEHIKDYHPRFTFSDDQLVTLVSPASDIQIHFQARVCSEQGASRNSPARVVKVFLDQLLATQVTLQRQIPVYVQGFQVPTTSTLKHCAVSSPALMDLASEESERSVSATSSTTAASWLSASVPGSPAEQRMPVITLLSDSDNDEDTTSPGQRLFLDDEQLVEVKEEAKMRRSSSRGSLPTFTVFDARPAAAKNKMPSTAAATPSTMEDKSWSLSYLDDEFDDGDDHEDYHFPSRRFSAADDDDDEMDNSIHDFDGNLMMTAGMSMTLISIAATAAGAAAALLLSPNHKR